MNQCCLIEITEEEYNLIKISMANLVEPSAVKIRYNHLVKMHLCKRHSHQQFFMRDADRILTNDRYPHTLFHNWYQVKTWNNRNQIFSKRKLLINFDSEFAAIFFAYCSTLLFDYHEEKNCLLYMSCAFKFLFKAFELKGCEAFLSPNCNLVSKLFQLSIRLTQMFQYLNAIKEMKLEKDVYLSCIKAFCKQKSFVQKLLGSVSELSILLQDVGIERFSVLEIFENFNHRVFDTHGELSFPSDVCMITAVGDDFKMAFLNNFMHECETLYDFELSAQALGLTNICLVENSDTDCFISWLEAGARNSYSESEFQEIQDSIYSALGKNMRLEYAVVEAPDVMATMNDEEYSYLEFSPDVEESEYRQNIKFRVYQAVFLFVSQFHSKKTQALQALWLSIPDKFLTKIDFCSIRGDFPQINGSLPLKFQDLIKCWEWYDKEVAGGKSLVLQPRTLVHQARCFLRLNLNVTKNSCLSEGVKQLTDSEKKLLLFMDVIFPPIL